MEQLLIKVQYERAGQLFASVWLGGGGVFFLQSIHSLGKTEVQILIKQEHKQFFLKRRNSLTVRVTEHKLSREIVESPSLELFKNHLAMVLCN